MPWIKHKPLFLFFLFTENVELKVRPFQVVSSRSRRLTPISSSEVWSQPGWSCQNQNRPSWILSPSSQMLTFISCLSALWQSRASDYISLERWLQTWKLSLENYSPWQCCRGGVRYQDGLKAGCLGDNRCRTKRCFLSDAWMWMTGFYGNNV